MSTAMNELFNNPIFKQCHDLGEKIMKEEQEQMKEHRKTHKTMTDLTVFELISLGKMLSDERVAKFITQHGIADFGEGPAIGRNMNSGLIYIALEDSNFCICWNPQDPNSSIYLQYSSPWNGKEMSTTEEVSEFIIRLVEDKEINEFPPDERKHVREMFEAWEGLA